MKKLVSISIILFVLFIMYLLISYFISPSINKDKNIIVLNNNVSINKEELSKHNTKNDCWIAVENKVYNITDYFGKHPGGNQTMAPTCGIDATNAYKTQDPNAQNSKTKNKHSTKAQNILEKYYIGNLE